MDEKPRWTLDELIAWARDNANEAADADEDAAIRELVAELDRRGAELERLRKVIRTAVDELENFVRYDEVSPFTAGVRALVDEAKRS